MSEEIKEELPVEASKESKIPEPIKEEIKKVVDAGVELAADASKDGADALKKMVGDTTKPWYAKLGLAIGAVLLTGLGYILSLYHDSIVNWIMNLI